MASPTYVGAATRVVGAASSISVPTTIGVTGDFQLVALATTSSITPAAPSGWTRFAASSISGTGRLALFRRARAASEPTSVSFSLGETTAATLTLLVVRDVDPAVALVFASNDNLSSGTSPAPSINATAARSMLVTVHAARAVRTYTPPSGMSERSDISSLGLNNTGVSQSVNTLGNVVSGATGTRTSTLNSPAFNVAYAVALPGANFAPFAPTLTGPIGGAFIDRAVSRVFSWVPNDPDPGDSQSKYDLRYRLVGSSTWTTVTASVTTSQRTFPGGTFALGNHEWQVRTYDARGLVGPYSGSGFFTVTDPPPGPVFIAPVAGGTVGQYLFARWSTPEQDAYELRRVADNNGAPNTGVIYASTGVREAPTLRSGWVTFETNNRTEHVQLRVRFNGLWSPWTSAIVNVAYTVPPIPTFTLAVDNAFGTIAVFPTFPPKSGSQPVVEAYDLLRSEEGGEFVRIAAARPPSLSYTDASIAHLRDYDYRVRALGVNGTSSLSDGVDLTPAPVVVEPDPEPEPTPPDPPGTFTPANAVQSQSATSPTLTQVGQNALAPSSASQAQSATSPTLTQSATNTYDAGVYDTATYS